MTDYSNIGAICFDCAKAAGFTQKNKIVGVWVGECDFCGKVAALTSLAHDWEKKEEDEK